MKRNYDGENEADASATKRFPLTCVLIDKPIQEEPKPLVAKRVFFQSMWSYEQLRFLYGLRGIMAVGLVMDVAQRIMLDMLHLSTKIKADCGQLYTMAQSRRCYKKSDNPALFEAVLAEYEGRERQALDRQRRALADKGVPCRYIHILSHNSPVDGLGGLYPYESFEAYRDMEALVIPFPIVYQCVDIRDDVTIYRHLSHDTLPITEYLELYKEARAAYIVGDEDGDLLTENSLSFFSV